jgi:hypothetical protein
MSRLKYLTSFSFYDEKRIDKGETSKNFVKIVREKSKFILGLLEDKNKIREEKEKFAKYKNRIEGVSSEGKIGSVSSSSYQNSNNSISYTDSSVMRVIFN